MRQQRHLSLICSNITTLGALPSAKSWLVDNFSNSVHPAEQTFVMQWIIFKTTLMKKRKKEFFVLKQKRIKEQTFLNYKFNGMDNKTLLIQLHRHSTSGWGWRKIFNSQNQKIRRTKPLESENGRVRTKFVVWSSNRNWTNSPFEQVELCNEHCFSLTGRGRFDYRCTCSHRFGRREVYWYITMIISSGPEDSQVDSITSKTAS